MSEPLADWDTRAGVRVDPRRMVGAQLEAGRSFFPSRLMPYLDHPLVRSLAEPVRAALSARHLYHYLAFTARFEVEVVNRAAARIAGGRCGLELGAADRLDALRIYTDEGYHALYSLDLIQQVEAASGIPALPYDFGPYLGRLDEAGLRVLPEEPLLVQLLQVVVFETLVTAILTDVPADPTVLEVVRAVVRDHARDEGRHHAYFTRFFDRLWPALGPGLQERVARCLPELVRRSLWPDEQPVRAALTAAGLRPGEVADVLAGTYRTDAVLAEIRRVSRHTLRLFESAGVLAVPGAADAFAAAGLLAEGAPCG